MELSCKKCGLYLGELTKGKIRNEAVLLCDSCWTKANAAMDIAEQARRDTPEFMKDLFGGFGKTGK